VQMQLYTGRAWKRDDVHIPPWCARSLFFFRGLLDYYANRSHIIVKDKNTSEFEDDDEGRDEY
jgi:hypothetical protein